MVDSVKELTRISQELKQKTEKVNKAIQEMDEQLAQLELGREIWLQSLPLESVVAGLDRGSHEEFVRLLGYCRFKDGWHLAVCAGYLKPFTEDEKKVLGRWAPRGRATYSRRNLHFHPIEEGPDALLKCSREIRVKSLKLIPPLLDLVNAEAEELAKLMDTPAE